MSENRELSYHGHDKNDEESDIIYTPGLHEEDNDRIDDSSDIKKALHKPRKIRDTWDTVNMAIENHESDNVSVCCGGEMIDTFDGPVDTIVEDIYARSESYVDYPLTWMPMTGVCAEAGVGGTRAQYGVLVAEVKGPNVSACAEASPVGAGAMAQAELVSVSAQAGPIGVKLGVGVETGVSADLVKKLRTRFSFGPKASISVLGSEVSCSVM